MGNTRKANKVQRSEHQERRSFSTNKVVIIKTFYRKCKERLGYKSVYEIGCSVFYIHPLTSDAFVTVFVL